MEFRRADQRVGAGAAGKPLAVAVISMGVVRLGKFLLAGHVGIDRCMVSHRHGVAGVISLCFLHRLSADDMRHRIDADVTPGLVCPFADVGDMATCIGDLGKGRKEVVALGSRKIAPGSAKSGVHRHRSGRLQAGRAANRILQRVVGPVIIERLVGSVEEFDDFQPLGSLIISLFDQRHAEHAEFLRIPAADDVEPGPALADMIDGGQRLGSIERMNQRHVNGHE